MTTPALLSFVSGGIAYRGRDGGLVGRERFELTSHPGGHSLRAYCEMDYIGLLRDVNLSLDAAWRPIDAFCRVTSGGEVVGSTWFGVEDDAVRVEGFVAGRGRVRQRLETPVRCPYIGLHPLQGDALIVTQCPDGAPGDFRSIRGITNSISPTGDAGLVGVPVAIGVTFVGHDRIEVPAGRFDARRYALRWSPE